MDFLLDNTNIGIYLSIFICTIILFSTLIITSKHIGRDDKVLAIMLLIALAPVGIAYSTYLRFLKHPE